MKQWTLRKQWTFVVSIVFHALLLVVVYVLQGMVFPYVRFFGLVPLLLPIVSTGAAVYQGRIAGGIIGLFAGILCDISFIQPVGVFTVVLTIAGVFVGYLADTVMARGFATYIISCAVVLSISAFAQIFPLMFFANVASTPLLTLGLRQTIYSLLYAVPIWVFVRGLGIRAQRESPSGRPL